MTKKLDSFHLKLIAIIAMLINHIGSGFKLFEYSNELYFFTELVGKLTFPIMAFLLVEGFHYTKNIKKYASRLAIFWIVSIYPFHLLHLPNSSFSPTELVNNIFFTLLMGLILIVLYEKTNNVYLHILLVIIFSLATIMSDWNLFGVLMIFGFYRIKDAKLSKIIPPLYTTVIMFVMMLIGHLVSPSSVPISIVISTLGILGTIPLLLNYNGQRGYSPTWVKWGFYLFYPLHMIILIIIRGLL
ncbi:Fimbrial assembly protein fimC [Carnobacterium maltaromaticum]|uniref:TraX family protein n=1 Tax=Carnobacterium maltaromaticum TaxID=2751 RepID=UPI00191BB704|nr:TraX family protein [Carnobacterium maltaromaticum]CAD5899685.1 Fimbrial assembly protein fimC [Carnobacterium maltaromaticum]